VRYGVCGMLAPGDTLGLSFIAAQPLPLQVTGPLPDPQPASASKSRTCYKYTVRPPPLSALPISQQPGVISQQPGVVGNKPGVISQQPGVVRNKLAARRKCLHFVTSMDTQSTH
jgi:hypothetical protein